MKKINKNIKWIIIVIIAIILTSGISVYATNTYLANQILYTTDKNAEIKNVADALNDLYNKKNESNAILLGSDIYDSTHYYDYEYTYDLSSYANFQQFTDANFLICFKKIEPMQSSGNNSMSGEISKMYNNETGILTLSLSECKFNTIGMRITVDVYLIK